ncbi:MAG TPA: hypothetical protein VLU98_01695 [Methanomicrobiales archaeon]|nr:hypothetical protein [Methanomicrobiales archaeon]
MRKRDKKIGMIIVIMTALVALFQLLWPPFYPVLVSLNPYPTEEYLRITWLFSPIGLSVITVVMGIILIAWVRFVEP